MTIKEPEDEEFDRIEREQSFKQSGYSSITYTVPDNVGFTVPESAVKVFELSQQSEPVLVIAKDGEVTWRGKVVESDEEFKKAMMDVAAYFSNKDKPFPRRLTRDEVTHVWTTRFPPNSTINADTFVYEFADALQTYLGIGE